MNKKIISIFLATVMLLSVALPNILADNSKISFSDVDETSAEGIAIYKLAESGIINGNGDGTFTPLNSVTRAELCKMVNNIWGLTVPADTGFKDVTQDMWYYNHVLIGKKAGYINGFDDGTFRGDSFVTREQACAILCRVAGLYDIMYTGKIEDEVSDWAKEYVEKVLGNGLMFTEEGNTFRATENMKRGELATVLSNFLVAEPDADDKTDTDNKTDKTDKDKTESGSTGGGSTGGGSTGGGSTGGGSTGGGNTQPEVDYTEDNKEVIAQLTTAKSELSTKKGLFTDPEKEIINIVIDVLEDLIADKSEYIISTESVYAKYTDEIMEAMGKYSDFDASSRSGFVSKISQLNNEVFDFLETFFGIDFSDVEDELQS